MRRPIIGIGWLLDAVSRSRFAAAIEACAIGLMLGLFDVHSTISIAPFLSFLAAGCALGLRHGGSSWQAWSPMGWCFYLMHRAAIACGYRPPYVYPDPDKALLCFFLLVPAGVGLALGALVRLGLSRLAGDSAGPGQRRPLTVGGLMVVVALISLHLAALRVLILHEPFFGLGTVYAERYSEARFRSLRVGMSREEVEAIIGRPLRIVPHGPHGEEMWHYSDQPDATANYHRRWVYFEAGKLRAVVSDFWFD